MDPIRLTHSSLAVIAIATALSVEATLIPSNAPEASVNSSPVTRVVSANNRPLDYFHLISPAGPNFLDDSRPFAAFDINSGHFKMPAAANPFPIGQSLNQLPKGAIPFLHQSRTLYHYEGFFFSITSEKKYVVIEPPIGAVLFDLPTTATELPPDDASKGETRFIANGVYFRPVVKGPNTYYEIVK